MLIGVLNLAPSDVPEDMRAQLIDIAGVAVSFAEALDASEGRAG